MRNLEKFLAEQLPLSIIECENMLPYEIIAGKAPGWSVDAHQFLNASE